VNTKSSLIAELKDKEYRDAFVASQIRIGLPLQCRALRESRELTQPALAAAAGMTQPQISEIERPGERRLNIETLLRLASAYDVALQVRFVPFSQLIHDDDDIDLEHLEIAPFEEDLANHERMEEQMKSVVVIGGAHRAADPAQDEPRKSAPKVETPKPKTEAKTEARAIDEGAKIVEENNGIVSSIARQGNSSIRGADVESSPFPVPVGSYLRAS
jgi:transcriptional regulator with XRE-family HTH domain